MKSHLILNPRIAAAVFGLFLVVLPGMVLANQMTVCDCANKPIKDDREAAECARVTRMYTPEVLATKVLECREALAAPADGPDICFCMRSNSQDPAVQQACLALVDSISPSDMYSVTKDCAKKQYQD